MRQIWFLYSFIKDVLLIALKVFSVSIQEQKTSKLLGELKLEQKRIGPGFPLPKEAFIFTEIEEELLAKENIQS